MGLEWVSDDKTHRHTDRQRESERGLDKNRSTSAVTHGSRTDSLVEEEQCVCVSACLGACVCVCMIACLCVSACLHACVCIGVCVCL